LVSALSLVGYFVAAQYWGYLGVSACSLVVSLLGQGLALHCLRRSDAAAAVAIA